VQRRFQSDKGDQLVAASKQLATWDWSKVDELCGQKGATWRLAPTGGQHLSPSLTKRLHHLEEIKKEFWKKWMAKVFPGPSAGPQVEKAAPRHPVGQCRRTSEELVKTAAGVEFQRGTVDPPRY
jgi:hypothetical protein